MRRLWMVFGVFLWCLPAQAQEGDGVSPGVARALVLVSEAMDAGREAEALERLEVLSGRRLRPLERALVAQTRGYLLARAERYPEAIAAFRTALETGALSGRALQDLRLNLGQLLLVEGEDEAGLAVLQAWMEAGGELTPSLVDWLAYAYYRSGRAEEAAALLDRALGHFPPRRTWFELRVALYLEADELEEAVALLRRALARFPGSSFFWRQLAAAQLRLEREGEALASLAVAWQQGLLPAEDVVLLARLFGQVGAPYHGARVLREALVEGRLPADAERWGVVGELFAQAREREAALGAFGRAARLSRDGRWDLRRGEVLVGLSRWQDAEAALEAALAKGLDRPARARYLLGVALAEQGRHEAARARFQALQDDAHLGPLAKRWLQRLGAG